MWDTPIRTTRWSLAKKWNGLKKMMYSGGRGCRHMGNKDVHAFPKSISPKVNVIARLEFEPAYNDIVVRHVSLYAMVTPPNSYISHLQCNEEKMELDLSYKRFFHTWSQFVGIHKRFNLKM